MFTKAWIGVVAGVVLTGAAIGFAREEVLGNPGVTVVYEVTGWGLANIAYVHDTVTKTEQAELPWRKEVIMTVPKFLVSVSAHGLGGDGPFRCAATVDGDLFTEAGRPPLEGSIMGLSRVDCSKPFPA